MVEEAVGRYVLLLGDGGIEHSPGGGSTRWSWSPCWQAHTLCGYGEIQRTSEPLVSGKLRTMPFLLRTYVSKPARQQRVIGPIRTSGWR